MTVSQPTPRPGVRPRYRHLSSRSVCGGWTPSASAMSGGGTASPSRPRPGAPPVSRRRSRRRPPPRRATASPSTGRRAGTDRPPPDRPGGGHARGTTPAWRPAAHRTGAAPLRSEGRGVRPRLPQPSPGRPGDQASGPPPAPYNAGLQPTDSWSGPTAVGVGGVVAPAGVEPSVATPAVSAPAEFGCRPGRASGSRRVPAGFPPSAGSLGGPVAHGPRRDRFRPPLVSPVS